VIPPDEFGAIFLAQVAALGLIRIWEAGRQASREELGNRPRPAHDGIHLIFTGLAIVSGLVLLIILVSRPIRFPYLAGSGDILVPAIAFLTFVYLIFVIGIRSSHHTSGNKSSPWLCGLYLFATAALLLAAMMLLMFLLPHTRVPQRLQGWLAWLIGVAAVVVWQLVVRRLQHRRSSASYVTREP
jgi:hypothetical protein